MWQNPDEPVIRQRLCQLKLDVPAPPGRTAPPLSRLLRLRCKPPTRTVVPGEQSAAERDRGPITPSRGVGAAEADGYGSPPVLAKAGIRGDDTLEIACMIAARWNKGLNQRWPQRSCCARAVPPRWRR